MSEFIFTVKIFFLTAIFVLLLQIKIGDATIDEGLTTFIRTSVVAQPVQEAAQGGAVFLREIWKKISGNFNSKSFDSFKEKNLPGSRELGLSLKRSKKYLEDKVSNSSEGAEE